MNRPENKGINNYGMDNLKQYKYKRVLEVKQDSILENDEMVYRGYVTKKHDSINYLRPETRIQTENRFIGGIQQHYQPKGVSDDLSKNRFFVDNTYYRYPKQDLSNQSMLGDKLKPNEYNIDVNKLLTKQQREQHEKLYGVFLDQEIERKHQPVRVYSEFDVQQFMAGIGENAEKKFQ